MTNSINKNQSPILYIRLNVLLEEKKNLKTDDASLLITNIKKVLCTEEYPIVRKTLEEIRDTLIEKRPLLGKTESDVLQSIIECLMEDGTPPTR